LYHRWLPTLALAVLLPVMPAGADVAPEALQRGLRAAAEFARQVPEGTPAERLPRLADPAARPMLEALWNTPALLAGRPESQAHGAELKAWSDGAGQAARRYLAAFGAGGASQQEAVRRMLGFQDETSRAFAFLLRASTSLYQATQDRLAAQPPGEARRRQVLESLGGGLAQLSAGILFQLREPRLRPENARLMAASLAEDLPLFLPVLSAEARRGLDQAAQAALPAVSDPAARAALERIRNGLGAGR
jgi:hypothetical protein